MEFELHFVSSSALRFFRKGAGVKEYCPRFVNFHRAQDAFESERGHAAAVRASAIRARNLFITALCAVFILLAAADTQAANITTTQSGDWDAGTTWAGGLPPGPGDNVTIASSHVVTVSVEAAAASISIEANTSGTNGITINSGIRLDVSGAITMTAPTSGTSTISVGAGILNAASIAIPGSTTAGRNCAVTVSTGTITITGSITFTGTAAQAQFVSTDASTINVGGNFESGGTLTTTGTGTINFNGSTAQTLGTYTTYNNITINNTSGSVTLTGTTTIGGALTVTAGTFTVGPYTLTVTGVASVTGRLSITSATGTKTFTGDITINNGGSWDNTSGNEAIAMAGSLRNDGTFGAGTGVYTFSGAMKTIDGVSAVSIPNLTVNGTVTNNGTLTVSTALAGSGTLTNGTNATLNIGRTLGITTLTTTASPNTVNYSGAAQTVRPITYHHLTLSGSGTKTLTNVGTINGNLTLSGTCSATTAIATTIGGNLSVGTGTTFTVAGFDLTVTGTTSVSGTLAHSSATGTKTYIGLVTIESGGSWTNASNSAITFQGGLTHNGTTFSSGTGVYTFGTNHQMVEGGSALTINNVIVNGITLTNSSTNFTVSAALSGTGELVQGAGATLCIGGTLDITTLTATASPNTVYYSGAAQTVKASSYHHLTLSGSGAKTLPSSTLTINGDFTVLGTASVIAAAAIHTVGSFTIGPSASFTAGSFTHDLKGGFSNSNTFTASDGSITFTGTSDQSIGGSAITTFNNLTINKVNGTVMVNTTFNVSEILTFAGGNINTGANAVVITSTGSVSRTSGHVVGNLRKQISAGSPSQTFEIGDASSYCPVSVSFSGITSSGDLTATLTAGDHPNIASSTIDSVQSANKYWTLANSGIVFTNCDAGFSFNAGDIDGGSNTGLFKVGRYAGGVWTYPVVGVRTATSTEATALAEFGDFSVGEDRPDPPVLASIGSRSVAEGDTLAIDVSANDADGDSLSLSAVNLPTNANFTDNGEGTGNLNFNPGFTQAGVYNVTFIASDGVLADSEIVAIEVTALNAAPVLASIDSQLVAVGDTLTVGVIATDPDGDSLILSAENLPPNANFSDNHDGTGGLTFIPDFTQTGVYNVTFIASDGVLADSEVVAITVVRDDSVTISGNAGVAGATLNYVCDTTYTATADGSGGYSFSVAYDWSGTVMPSKTGYTFTPTTRTYANVISDQIEQDFTVSIILDVGQDVDNPTPDKFQLAQNYPNPFNPVTTISFALPAASDVTIEVFNIMGQRVATLAQGRLEAGEYLIHWDGRVQGGGPAATGVYFYRLQAGDFVETKKMLLIK